MTDGVSTYRHFTMLDRLSIEGGKGINRVVAEQRFGVWGKTWLCVVV